MGSDAFSTNIQMMHLNLCLNAEHDLRMKPSFCNLHESADYYLSNFMLTSLRLVMCLLAIISVLAIVSLPDF
ncbi:hypothetical protein Csa_003756 [Cucumis sativus]|uniref:Uncharacterized protein n=1 Tax=Cucumis sativus TaxID=3659 RepID=A0A0A0KJF9_CUCSA|nr:hypothetical protein Csa_003756 [Cucumis sativus]